MLSLFIRVSLKLSSVEEFLSSLERAYSVVGQLLLEISSLFLGSLVFCDFYPLAFVLSLG